MSKDETENVQGEMSKDEGEDFMFEVTREELSRCQIGTLDIKRGKNIKYLPFAFTELGVAMPIKLMIWRTFTDTNLRAILAM
jgi:hypothetical protein